MIKRIWSLVVKEFIHLRKDWWLPAFMLIGGTMELLLVGWATSRPITNLPVMILDEDQSPASRELITSLMNTETFVIKEYVSDQETIQEAMDLSQINAAFLIPPGFGDAVNSHDETPVFSVLLNGAESIPARTALRSVEGVVMGLNEEILIRRLNLDDSTFAGFDFSMRVWFNEELKEAHYSVPAELALMLEFTILIFAALSLSRERELGTLEQLLVMPFSSLEIIIGKSIPVIIVGICDFALMLTVTNLFFSVPVRGSLILMFALAFIYTLVELGKGLFISVISKTQHQAFLTVMVWGMIDFMFTGYAAPVESMPEVLQTIANIIPAHHWLAIMRGLMLKGAGLDVLYPHVLALLVLGLIIGGFSLRYVRRALD